MLVSLRVLKCKHLEHCKRNKDCLVGILCVAESSGVVLA